jgi:hypothetical protein
MRILSSLRLKREQAEIVVHLYSMPAEFLPNGRVKWTETRTEEFQKAQSRVKELNRRGPVDPPSNIFAQLVGNRWVKREVNLFGEQWETFSGPWPKWGMCLDGVASELPTWEPATVDRESSSWLTPMTPNGGRKLDMATTLRKGVDANGIKRTVDLSNQAEYWPTPVRQDAAAAARGTTTTGVMHPGTTLTDATRNWPTPAQRDSRDPNLRSYQERSDTKKGEQLNNFVAHNWPSPLDLVLPPGASFCIMITCFAPLFLYLSGALPSPYNKLESMLRRKLNPDFVDWLMGWPVGWSDAAVDFKPEEMASWLSRQRAYLQNLLKG